MTAPAEPTLFGVVELMQRQAAEAADPFLDRVGCLVYGIADAHRNNRTCSVCNNRGDQGTCPQVLTATEAAFAWLMAQRVS